MTQSFIMQNNTYNCSYYHFISISLDDNIIEKYEQIKNVKRSYLRRSTNHVCNAFVESGVMHIKSLNINLKADVDLSI